MERLLTYWQLKYHFTDYQIAKLGYLFKTLASEISKLIIMAVLFHDRISYYLFAVTLLFFLRIHTGGLHFNSYLSCLITSSLYFFLSIYILPMFFCSKLIELILLFICILITYYIGPVTSKYRPKPTKEFSKKCRISTFNVIFFYLILTYIFPQTLYISVGFWVIILHTLQLVIAKRLKKGGFKECSHH